MSTSLFTGIDQEKGPRLNTASLIDIGFLLLTFFMVSATLQKQEADLNVRMPEVSREAIATTRIEQMRIHVTPHGTIELNREPLSRQGGLRDAEVLQDRLERYAAVASMSGSKPRVVIDCDDAAAEQRFIDVLNACSRAAIREIQLAP